MKRITSSANGGYCAAECAERATHRTYGLPFCERHAREYEDLRCLMTRLHKETDFPGLEPEPSLPPLLERRQRRPSRRSRNGAGTA